MLDGCFVAVGTAAKTRSAQTFPFGYFARVSVFLWNTHLKTITITNENEIQVYLVTGITKSGISSHSYNRIARVFK